MVLTDKLRGRISMVASVKSMGTHESDGEDQIGGKKHHPKFYPASPPSPLAARARQKRAYQPADARHNQRPPQNDEELCQQR
jgi:hypothetical protein